MTATEIRGAFQSPLLNSENFSQRAPWLVSIPFFMGALYVFFAFVGHDWGWAYHTISDDTASQLARERAFNSGIGRFFYVLFAAAYCFYVFRKVFEPISLVKVRKAEMTDLDATRVEDCVNGILDGWTRHFKSEALVIDEAYVGRDAQKASDRTKEIVQMTLGCVSDEVRTALQNELRTPGQ